MEKSTYQLDFDDWEFLPDTKFLDHHDNRKKGKNQTVFEPKTASPGAKYFIIQSPASPHIVTTPVPIHLQPIPNKNSDEILLPPVEEKREVSLGLLTAAAAADHDTVSRVFFKKMKENEFVDMKMDSPKSGNRGVKFQSEPELVKFEEKEEQDVVNKKNISHTKKINIWKNNSVNIWGWKLTGIEALCCVGIAAATTICIFIFGRNRKHKQIQSPIYSEDKKMKQVVQKEGRPNGGTPEARGSSPLNGAHLIFGSY